MRIILYTILLLAPVFVHAQRYGREGTVVSSSQIASTVGREILQQGGNAIDASIATAFALAVTHPAAGNIGGGGFMVYMDAEGTATTIDFREKAPLAATRDMYLDENGNLVPGSNHNSIRAIGVPGTVAGLWYAHKKYGVLEWSKLVQPAVELAAEGFPMPYGVWQDARNFSENPSSTPFISHYFDNQNGQLTAFQEVWKQPALANTLSLIRDKGKDGFYAGPVAQEIEDYMQKNGGLITREDLALYEATERAPVTGTYEDYTIYSMPPPSSGGIVLIEMLNMAEALRLDTIPFQSATYIHLLAEIMRRGYADRAKHLGDPDFNPSMPADHLISKAHAASLVSGIKLDAPSKSDSSRFAEIYESEHTTHFSVVDKDGAAVSVTYTLEYSYGSRMGSENLGFIFNNEMGDFNPVAGLTNNRGLIGTTPNLIAPQKRMLSSMTPTIVAKNGRPYLVIGTPGGRTIISTVFQTVFCHLGYNMTLFESIESLKIHHQWLPDRIIYEVNLLSPDSRMLLENMGHQLIPAGRLGSLMGIVIDPDTGILEGISDSSAPDGGVSGY